VTLGGVAGANLGFLVGYGLTRWETIEPRDFGWLSLFGAAGTALGGGVGALLSDRSDPRPVLLGLAAGPAIGLLTGAFVMPHLHAASPPVARLSRKRAAATDGVAVNDGDHGDLDGAVESSDAIWERQRQGEALGPHGKASDLLHITQWMPIVGALSAPASSSGTAGSPPFIFGLSGLWR
jgi:hypothetical protein